MWWTNNLCIKDQTCLFLETIHQHVVWRNKSFSRLDNVLLYVSICICLFIIIYIAIYIYNYIIYIIIISIMELLKYKLECLQTN